MGNLFKIFLTISIFWFILYLISLRFTAGNWFECLLLGLILIPILLILGLLTGGYTGGSLDFKSSYNDTIRNKISYLGGIIILWSMFFLPILSYTTIDNIEYDYWFFGLFRYNDPKFLLPYSGFISTYFYTNSGTFSLVVLLLIVIAINYYSHLDKSIILIFLGIFSILLLVVFYFWQLYELTPMLKEAHFPNNRNLLPAIGFYAILIGGLIIIAGGIESIFFSAKITSTNLSKQTSQEMENIDQNSKYCLNCRMIIKKSNIYCPYCGIEQGNRAG